MTTPTERGRSHARSPERFLAIAAVAHRMADTIPADRYPIEDWDALRAAVTDLDVDVRAPEGRRLGADSVVRAVDRIAPRVGDGHFPLRDPDDLVHKAGRVLVSLVLTHHRMQVPDHRPVPDLDAHVAALRATTATERT